MWQGWRHFSSVPPYVSLLSLHGMLSLQGCSWCRLHKSHFIYPTLLPFSSSTRTQLMHSFSCSVSFFERVPHLSTAPCCCTHLDTVYSGVSLPYMSVAIPCVAIRLYCKYCGSVNLADFPKTNKPPN